MSLLPKHTHPRRFWAHRNRPVKKLERLGGSARNGADSQGAVWASMVRLQRPH